MRSPTQFNCSGIIDLALYNRLLTCPSFRPERRRFSPHSSPNISIPASRSAPPACARGRAGGVVRDDSQHARRARGAGLPAAAAHVRRPHSDRSRISLLRRSAARRSSAAAQRRGGRSAASPRCRNAGAGRRRAGRRLTGAVARVTPRGVCAADDRRRRHSEGDRVRSAQLDEGARHRCRRRRTGLAQSHRRRRRDRRRRRCGRPSNYLNTEFAGHAARAHPARGHGASAPRAYVVRCACARAR